MLAKNPLWDWQGLTRAQAVLSIAIDPVDSRTIYVGAVGIFKTTNGGDTWHDANVGYLPKMVDDDGDVSIMAGATSPVFVGQSGDGAVGAIQVNAIGVSPGNHQVLYASSYIGVFQSLDAGGSWAYTGQGNPAAQAIAIAPSNGRRLYALYYSGEGYWVSGSRDGGITWRGEITSDVHWPWGIDSGEKERPVPIVLAVHPTAAETLILGGWGVAIGTTTAGFTSSTWTDRVLSLAVAADASATMYAGTDGSGIRSSIDGGRTWARRGGSLASEQVTQLAIDPTDSRTLYGSTRRGGVFKSTDGAETWNPSGLAAQQIVALEVAPTNPQCLYAATGRAHAGGLEADKSAGLLRSLDGGMTWKSISAGIPGL